MSSFYRPEINGDIHKCLLNKIRLKYATVLYNKLAQVLDRRFRPAIYLSNVRILL